MVENRLLFRKKDSLSSDYGSLRGIFFTSKCGIEIISWVGLPSMPSGLRFCRFGGKSISPVDRRDL
jgi:hypothetical protein